MPKKKKKEDEVEFLGRVCKFTGSDGIEREVSLTRSSDSRMRLAYQTWWNGIDKEPFTTHVILTLPALNATMSLLAELQAFPELFQVPVSQGIPD